MLGFFGGIFVAVLTFFVQTLIKSSRFLAALILIEFCFFLLRAILVFFCDRGMTILVIILVSACIVCCVLRVVTFFFRQVSSSQTLI